MDDGKRNWRKEIKIIKKSKLRFSKHFKLQIKMRCIKMQDINNVLQFGEIIQGHAPGKYDNNIDHVRVILGYGVKENPLHLVVALRKEVVLVTAYEPNLKIWENDYKTLKKKKT